MGEEVGTEEEQPTQSYDMEEGDTEEEQPTQSYQSDDNNVDTYNYEEKPYEEAYHESYGNSGGLINLGNTCYFNAVIQALHSLEKFRMQLYTDEPYEDVSLYKRWHEVETRFDEDRNFAVNPTYLRDEVCKKSTQFDNYYQHDVHEFLFDFLSEMESALEKKTKHNTIEEFFGSKIIKKITCKTCSHERKLKEVFRELPLPMTQPEVEAVPQVC